MLALAVVVSQPLMKKPGHTLHADPAFMVFHPEPLSRLQKP